MWGGKTVRKGGNRAAVLLGSLLWLTSCQDQPAAPTKPQQAYTGPILETTDVTTLFSDSARLQVRLQAPLEQQFENGDLVYPKGVKATFYSKDGLSVVNTLRGNYGKFTRATNVYEVRGDVRVRNEVKEQSMATKRLFYDRGKAQIYTEDSVEITTPTERLTGVGLTANEDFSLYEIKHPTGVFDLNASEGIKP